MKPGGSTQNGIKPLEAMPVGSATEAPTFMELNLHDEWLMPVGGAPYRVVFEDGTIKEGVLDASGHARIDGVPKLPAQVFYGESPAKPSARTEMPANVFSASSSTNEEAIASIERYLGEADTFWQNQASSEQRELFAEMNNADTEASGESAWHDLSEVQQQALSQKLQGGAA